LYAAGFAPPVLEAADAQQTLYADGILDQLRTVTGRVDREGAIADEDGLGAYRTFSEVATTLPDDPEESDPRDCQREVLELYKAGREEGRWLTQCDVAESGDVTPTTVRTHHETLEEQVTPSS
jgi:hypothetical protein